MFPKEALNTVCLSVGNYERMLAKGTMQISGTVQVLLFCLSCSLVASEFACSPGYFPSATTGKCYRKTERASYVSLHQYHYFNEVHIVLLRAIFLFLAFKDLAVESGCTEDERLVHGIAMDEFYSAVTAFDCGVNIILRSNYLAL